MRHAVSHSERGVKLVGKGRQELLGHRFIRTDYDGILVSDQGFEP